MELGRMRYETICGWRELYLYRALPADERRETFY